MTTSITTDATPVTESLSKGGVVAIATSLSIVAIVGAAVLAFLWYHRQQRRYHREIDKSSELPTLPSESSKPHALSTKNLIERSQAQLSNSPSALSTPAPPYMALSNNANIDNMEKVIKSNNPNSAQILSWLPFFASIPSISVAMAHHYSQLFSSHHIEAQHSFHLDYNTLGRIGIREVDIAKVQARLKGFDGEQIQ